MLRWRGQWVVETGLERVKERERERVTWQGGRGVRGFEGNGRRAGGLWCCMWREGRGRVDDGNVLVSTFAVRRGVSPSAVLRSRPACMSSFQIKLVATVEDYIYNVKVVAGCTPTTHFQSY